MRDQEAVPIPPRPAPHLEAYVPQLLPSLDRAGAEEGDPGEPQVLVGHEDSHGHEVGLAVVVDEPADVAVEPCVDAVRLSILGRGAGQSWGLQPSSGAQACPPPWHTWGTFS